MGNYEKNIFKFIDSLRFLSTTLQTLSENLNEDQFLETGKLFTDAITIQLFKKNKIFPYSFVYDIKH